MTIKTLTYIHNLLKEDVAAKEDTKKFVYKAWSDAAEKNNPNADQIRKPYNLAKDKYYEALHALEEFEAKEW